VNDIRPEIQGASIVLIGDFNPKIFQPAWFASQDLIRNEEAQNAEIQIVHQALVDFSLEWLKVQVRQDRFSAGTHLSPYYTPLKDFVVGTFRILRHTPIRMMGINCDYHLSIGSEDRWHALGHRLTPKEIWERVLEKPGMRSLSVEGVRPDQHKGRLLVRVEPSVRIKYGVFITVNDHYELKDTDSPLGCDKIIDILAESWEVSVSRSNEIAFKILEEK
jgi:hypothetical protein